MCSLTVSWLVKMQDDLFEIVGDELRTKMQFDYESKSSYTVCAARIPRFDSLNRRSLSPLTISTNAVRPEVVLTSFGKCPVGTVVGELNATDPDADDVLTYRG